MGFRKKSRNERLLKMACPMRMLALDGGAAGQQRLLDVKQKRSNQRGE
jgi:hypothetical protein